MGRAVLAALIGAIVVTLPASASAATRFASPTGTGTACTQSVPCDIQTAIEDPAVVDGDEVVLQSSTFPFFSINDELDITDAIRVRSNGTGLRPQIRVGGAAAYGVGVFHPGATLQDVGIGGSGFALWLSAGTAERVIATASGTDALACGIDPSPTAAPLLRDSVCQADGSFALAVDASIDTGGAPSLLARLRNVTAQASGSGSTGILLEALGDGAARVDVLNTIVNGATADAHAVGDATTSSQISLGASNFDTQLEGANGTVTDPGTAGNQTAAPVLRGYFQLSGSPTVDAGATDPFLGSLDLSGNARVAGSAPDIGADEAPQCKGRVTTVTLDRTPGSSGGTGNRINGTGKADVLVGTPAAELIHGFQGNDVICGGGGNDQVLGDGGRDKLLGEAGKDIVKGGKGNDLLLGGFGNDRLDGGPNNDLLKGQQGRDTLVPGKGRRDRCRGGPGRDATGSC